jgi:hypothetical protein
MFRLRIRCGGRHGVQSGAMRTALSFALLSSLAACSSSGPRPSATDEVHVEGDDAHTDVGDTAPETAMDGAGDVSLPEGDADAATDANDASSADASVALAMSARIHEFRTRSILGTSFAPVFVEIAAPPGTALEALKVRSIDCSGSDQLTELSVGPATMPASGVWVLTDDSATHPDRKVSISVPAVGTLQLLYWPLGSDPVLIDTVGYTTPGYTGSCTPVKFGPTTATEGSRATTGDMSSSLGRGSFPGDTNDNATDFCVQVASPGVRNGGC